MNAKTSRNVLVTLGAQLLSAGMTFVVTLFLPRYLGDVGLGRLAFAASLVSIFGVIVPCGTSMVLIKGIARDRERTGELLRAVMCLRLPLAFVMMGLATAFVTMLGYPEATRLLVLAGGIGLMAETVNEALGAALKGQENLPRQNGTMLAERFLGSVLTIIAAVMQAPLWTIAAVGIVTSSLGFALNYPAFAPLLRSARALPAFGAVKTVALAGLPFLGWGAFQTLYGQIDPLALSLIAGDATAGWYAAAFRLIGTTLCVPGAVGAALLPTLSRLHGEDSEQFRDLARRMLSLLLLCAVPITAIFACAPEILLELLHYPASFSASIPVLRVGSVAVLLWYAACVIGTTVVASDGQKGMFRAAFVTTFISIPACFALSYITHRAWGNGAIGAMASDVLTECVLLLLYLRLLPRGFFGGEVLIRVGKCLLAAVPLSAFLLTVPGTVGKVGGIVAGTVIYLLVCFAWGYINPRQLMEMVRGIIGARRAPLPVTDGERLDEKEKQ